MMKDINEVIRRKEAELQQLQRDMEALRVASRLLAEEEGGAYASRPAASAYAAPPRPAPPPAASEAGYGASWDAAKKFP